MCRFDPDSVLAEVGAELGVNKRDLLIEHEADLERVGDVQAVYRVEDARWPLGDRDVWLVFRDRGEEERVALKSAAFLFQARPADFARRVYAIGLPGTHGTRSTDYLRQLLAKGDYPGIWGRLRDALGDEIRELDAAIVERVARETPRRFWAMWHELELDVLEEAPDGDAELAGPDHQGEPGEEVLVSAILRIDVPGLEIPLVDPKLRADLREHALGVIPIRSIAAAGHRPRSKKYTKPDGVSHDLA